MLKEFKEFAMRGNVIDLAVGVIIGASFGKIVSSLVERGKEKSNAEGSEQTQRSRRRLGAPTNPYTFGLRLLRLDSRWARKRLTTSSSCPSSISF